MPLLAMAATAEMVAMLAIDRRPTVALAEPVVVHRVVSPLVVKMVQNFQVPFMVM